jgi:hypothetical protein
MMVAVLKAMMVAELYQVSFASVLGLFYVECDDGR